MYWLNIEIVKQRDRLRELEATAYDCNAKLTGMPHGTGISDRTGNSGTAIAQLKTLIEINMQKCLDEIASLEEYINSFKDSRVRLIFRLKYINNLTWEEIGLEVGYTERQTRRIHSRNLKDVR